MKAILEFNLPEEKEELKLAQNGITYYCKLEEIMNYFRNEIKYNSDNYNSKQLTLLEQCKQKVYDIAGDIYD
jgi:hypothetical protein